MRPDAPPRSWLAALGLAIGLAVLPDGAGAQRGRPAAPAEPELPPLSMTCPLHPDVVESRPGRCPLCQTPLVPVRLDTAYGCPVHAAVLDDGPGQCPICRRTLNRVTVSLTWTCPAQPSIDAIERGTCADGTRMVLRRRLRAHGDHNPRHGGQFFMAPDNWHHLEGTYPRDRVFRLYLYDDFARPLPTARMRQVRARAVTREAYDPATRTARELASVRLSPSRDGAYLEARLEAGALPRTVTAKVRFAPEAPEYRFDFTFRALTAAPPPPPPRAAAPVAAGSRPTPAPEPRPAPGTPAPVSAPGSPLVAIPAPGTTVPPDADPDPALAVLPIPDSMSEIVEHLRRRDRHVLELIERGDFTAVWVPAFQARDLALALEPHLSHLPAAARDTAAPALRRVVQYAWLLDAVGDSGDREQLVQAYAAFTAAVGELAAAFSGVQ